MKDDVTNTILHNYFEELQTTLTTRNTVVETVIVLKLEQYVVVTKALREVHHVLSLSATNESVPNILVSAPHSMQGSIEEVLWRMRAIQKKMIKLIKDNTYDIIND
jgi:hypothetical protein